MNTYKVEANWKEFLNNIKPNTELGILSPSADSQTIYIRTTQPYLIEAIRQKYNVEEMGYDFHIDYERDARLAGNNSLF
jgi:hypothetical protein